MKRELDEERIAELKESFDQCDSNGDGRIQYDEFATLLDNLEADMSRQESWLGFQALDTDDNQTIDFPEFLAWWSDR